MTCILYQDNCDHQSFLVQDNACYPGLGDALDLWHQAFTLLGNHNTDRAVGSCTPTILRLTAYGMTEQAIHGTHGAHWVGHPIMRFVHSSHVQRLCGGLSEASKSGRPVAIPYIMCMPDPLSAAAASATAFHIVVQPVNTSNDRGFYCVLFPEQQDLGQAQQQHQIVVDTFMLLIRYVVTWLSTSPFRILVWIVTLLFLQKKKEA